MRSQPGKDTQNDGYIEDPRQRLDTLHALAKERRCRLIEPTAYELQLDLDYDGEWERLPAGPMTKISNRYGITEVERWRSSGGRWHAVVTLREPVRLVVRIALQAALGSDPNREVLNAMRADKGFPMPVVLMRPK